MLQRAQRFVTHKKELCGGLRHRGLPIERVFIQPHELVANRHAAPAKMTDRVIRAPQQAIRPSTSMIASIAGLGHSGHIAPDIPQSAKAFDAFHCVKSVKPACGMSQDQLNAWICVQ